MRIFYGVSFGNMISRRAYISGNTINLLRLWFIKIIKENYVHSISQGMNCEGAWAHAHVRCAVARVHVRAKRLFKYVRDVRACGHF